jgi:hypothetical protein
VRVLLCVVQRRRAGLPRDGELRSDCGGQARREVSVAVVIAVAALVFQMDSSVRAVGERAAIGCATRGEAEIDVLGLSGGAARRAGDGDDVTRVVVAFVVVSRWIDSGRCRSSRSSRPCVDDERGEPMTVLGLPGRG